MPQVTIEAEVVKDERENPHNQAGLPGYNPREDPNNAAYEDPHPNVLTGSYIPNSGLLPSVPAAVDDPTSPFYSDPGASDMLHSHPANVLIEKDGNLIIRKTEVTISDKDGKEVKTTDVADDATLLASGNKVEVIDKAAEKETEKETEKASKEAAKARSEELDDNDKRSREVMANPKEEVKK